MYPRPVLVTDSPLGSIQCLLGVDEEVIVAAHAVAQDMAAAMEAAVHPRSRCDGSYCLKVVYSGLIPGVGCVRLKYFFSFFLSSKACT